MERATPVRSSHTSTADLLTWPAVLPSDAASGNVSRSHQPSHGITKVFGGQISVEEAETLNKRKPCSGYKLKEITGSKIFAADGEDGGVPGSGTAHPIFENRAGLRNYQQALNGMSQISFSAEGSVSTKKPTTLPEVAKQRELSGTLESDLDTKIKKQSSDAKWKELSGNDIFGPPPEIPPRSLAAARSLESKESKDIGEPVTRNVRTSVRVSNPAGGQSNIFFSEESEIKTAKKIHNQKFAELTGNDIFKGDVDLGLAEKPISIPKLREISGNDIFADGKVESRDYLGGVRKPPGGDSNIALV